MCFFTTRVISLLFKHYRRLSNLSSYMSFIVFQIFYLRDTYYHVPIVIILNVVDICIIIDSELELNTIIEVQLKYNQLSIY